MGFVSQIAFTPDGKSLLVSAVGGGTMPSLSAFDPATWTQRWSVSKNTYPLRDFVAGDPAWVGLEDSNVMMLIDLATGKVLRALAGSIATSWCLQSLSPDRLLGVTAIQGEASCVSIFDTRSTQVTHGFHHAKSIVQVVLDPALRHAVCLARWDGTPNLSLWSFATGQKVHDFGGAVHPSSAIAFDPTGARVYVMGGVPSVYEASTGRKLSELREAIDGAPLAYATSPDHRRMVTSHGDQEDNHAPWKNVGLQIWDLTRGVLEATAFADRARPATRLAFAPDSRSLAMADGDDERVIVWAIEV
jgi:WD40 repeat protein